LLRSTTAGHHNACTFRPKAAVYRVSLMESEPK
jgi:hypothetical protein